MAIGEYLETQALGMGFGGAMGMATGRPGAVYRSPTIRGFAKEAFKRGGLESAGFDIQAGKNRGFLGGRGSLAKLYRTPRAFAQRGLMAGAKRGLGVLGKAVPVAFTGLLMYQGYQEGGVTGAIAGGAESFLWSAAYHAGTMLGGAGVATAATVATGAAVVAAAGYGYYAYGEAAQEYTKKLRHLELGGEVVDPFGTGATIRQRSLRALQNTHINGRMAMGNEAVLLHEGAFRR